MINDSFPAYVEDIYIQYYKCAFFPQGIVDHGPLPHALLVFLETDILDHSVEYVVSFVSFTIFQLYSTSSLVSVKVKVALCTIEA